MSQNHREKPHTAHFLVSRFLNSAESLEFPLSDIDCHVLRYLADLMDMTNAYSSLSQCRIPVSQAAKFTRLSPKSIKRSTARLIKLNLINPLVRKAGIIATYKLGNVFETGVSQTQVENVDNSNLGHTDPTLGHTDPGPGSHRPTSKKAFKKDFKKEQGDASGSSPPPVDSSPYLDRQSFRFTHGEMDEAIRRDIHIQPCFDRFEAYLLNKGKHKFKRIEWERWFTRETNGRNAKSERTGEMAQVLGHLPALEKKSLGEHYERQMAEHEAYKYPTMPDNVKAMWEEARRKCRG